MRRIVAGCLSVEKQLARVWPAPNALADPRSWLVEVVGAVPGAFEAISTLTRCVPWLLPSSIAVGSRRSCWRLVIGSLLIATNRLDFGICEGARAKFTALQVAPSFNGCGERSSEDPARRCPAAV